MHRQPHRLAERQPVGGAQRHVDRHPLGEVHLDRHPQRQVPGRQLDLTHVGHRHPGRGVDRQADPDRHRQVVAQRQRQRAALGGQGVGAAGVDDGDRTEQVVDGVADRRQPLLGQPVAGVGRHGLAQRAQHVLAQRRGVLGTGQPGAHIGGQRGRQTPQPAGDRRDAGGDGVFDAAPRVAHSHRRATAAGPAAEPRRPRRSPRSAAAAPPARRGSWWPPQ